MDPFSIAALVVGIVAAVAGAVTTGVSVHKTNQQNKELAGMQNQWNVEQWERENAYNAPANQVDRLKQAGLNPALAMSQSGIVDAGNAGSVAPAAGATMQPFQMDTSGFSSAMSSAAQEELMSAQAADLRSQTAERDELRPGKVKMQDKEIANLEQDLLNKAQDLKLSTAKERHEYAQIASEALNDVLNNEKSIAQINLWNTQSDLNQSLKLKNEEELVELVAFRDLRRRNLELSNQQIASIMNLNEAQVNHLAQLDKEMDSRWQMEYGDPAVKEWRKQMYRMELEYRDAQQKYQNDIRENPGKYRSQSHSESWRLPLGLFQYSNSNSW